MNENNQYDSIIIGAGAAGLTAAIYAARRALKVLVLSQDIGGQAISTSHIENYPGYEKTSGPELMSKFHNQALKFGAKMIAAEVKNIIKNVDGDFKVIGYDGSEYHGKSIILAFGLSHRHLDVPGENELIGKGVSYCATCDGPLYRSKTVAVVGGGNSAMESAIYLSKICKKVFLIHRRDCFTCENVLTEKAKSTDNIEMLLNMEVKELIGRSKLEKIIVKDVNDNSKKQTIEADGIFVEVGFIAKTEWVKKLVKLDEKNQIVIDKDNKTSASGVFAAGDLTDINFKQIVIAAGEGAKAALSANKYLQEKGLIKRSGFVDWGVKK